MSDNGRTELRNFLEKSEAAFAAHVDHSVDLSILFSNNSLDDQDNLVENILSTRLGSMRSCVVESLTSLIFRETEEWMHVKDILMINIALCAAGLRAMQGDYATYRVGHLLASMDKRDPII